MRLSLLAAAGLAAVISGCLFFHSSRKSEPRSDDGAAESVQSDPSIAEQDRRLVIADSNRFAFDLYARTRSTEGNLVFSPLSISIALAMPYAGSGGGTAEQIARVMHYSLPPQRFHPALGTMFKKMSFDASGPDNRGYQLSIANSLWGQAGFPWKDVYLHRLREYYAATLQQVDFAAAPEEARQQINSWTENQTHGRLKETIPYGTIDSETRLILANAIYFKGDWQKGFPKNATTERKFFVNERQVVAAPMMQLSDEFRAFETETVQGLELPFKGGDLSLLVLLPRAKNGLAALEQGLSAAKWAEYVGALKTCETVDVTLPSFRIEFNLPVTRELQAMGNHEAFNPVEANFSGMAEGERVFISAVMQKAFLEVNEEGAEAAAATGVLQASAVSSQTDPIMFRADHPFLFVLRGNRNGSILFMGRLTNPLIGH